ncbi:sigma-54-dependent Fis family transcriptional regulator [Geomicrobium sp. JCM 19038]|uniref:sigma-54 interaction domain-containing protein n=1 Tax=Geomicrobium sp. JCM 19038 TaxID=1460635 RepID=UPI00045F47E5|nr:sigma 54-interacting transcriptional regulator [Geomicrobium sp. JCM 19038]GAK10357.1 flagellar regulatory protein FleQ [Geomicrobium sp. JCM 19038]
MANNLDLELDAVLNHSTDNIVITDGRGHVLRASPSCAEIYGVTHNALIGRNVEQLELEGVFKPSITKLVMQTGKQQQVMQATVTGRTVMATAFPVRDEKKEIVRVISVSHDLTEIQEMKKEYESLQAQSERYQNELDVLRTREQTFHSIVHESKAISRIKTLISRTAPSDASVIFYGESGVGKSMFARELHKESKRLDGPFIEINCSAIPDTLFEAELFGYEKGAFTGADRQGRIGLVELSDEGTLFLDEIGDIPLQMQGKLLQVLQEKKVTPIGGRVEKHVDFRLVAATNRNLEQLVEKGLFREDLYYRINVIPITVPSLRERSEDVPGLIFKKVEEINERYDLKRKLHPQVLERLYHYHWPGNVRELENFLSRLLLTSSEELVTVEDLKGIFESKERRSLPATEGKPLLSEGFQLKEELKKVEQHWLQLAFDECNTTYEMSKLLGLSQPSVVRKLKEYKIDSKTNRDPKINQN